MRLFIGSCCWSHVRSLDWQALFSLREKRMREFLLRERVVVRTPSLINRRRLAEMYSNAWCTRSTIIFHHSANHIDLWRCRCRNPRRFWNPLMVYVLPCESITLHFFTFPSSLQKILKPGEGRRKGSLYEEDKEEGEKSRRSSSASSVAKLTEGKWRV